MGGRLAHFRDEEDSMTISVEKDSFYREVKKPKEELTGWERVKGLFETNDFGDLTPELERAKNTVMFTYVAGGICGGTSRSRIAYMDFFRSHGHEAFESHFDARRKMQEKILLGFGSGAFRVSWRAAAFTGCYMVTSICIAAYRGKYGILDQVGGAAAAGALYKFREGPRPMIAGCIIGSFLGFVAGSLTTGVLKLVGLKMEDIIEFSYQNVADKRRRSIEDIKEVSLEGQIEDKTVKSKEMTLTEFQQKLMEQKPWTPTGTVSKEGSVTTTVSPKIPTTVEVTTRENTLG